MSKTSWLSRSIHYNLHHCKSIGQSMSQKSGQTKSVLSKKEPCTIDRFTKVKFGKLLITAVSAYCNLLVKSAIQHPLKFAIRK